MVNFKLQRLLTPKGFRLVSIPQRDFGEFQVGQRLHRSSVSTTFQSLKGILVNFKGDRFTFSY
ncbi:hypothetical protein CKA32_001429 [Geitlerinema sp. FC II]|nr:hypothetical protein CKA32_001429 [Geitlerinema sp. FC II]